MITKMKKMTFLVTSREYEKFIGDIRNIGVVHIDELQSGATSPEFEAAKSLDGRYASALKSLDYAKSAWLSDEQFVPVSLGSVSNVAEAGLACVEEVERLLAEENALKHQIDAVEKDIHALEPWGEFDSAELEKLETQGYKVRFFVCSSKSFGPEWRDTYFATPISEVDKKLYFVTFSSETPDIAAENVILPAKRLSACVAERKQLDVKLDAVRRNLLKINGERREILLSAKVENENNISLSRVRLSAETLANESVKLMVGWLPVEKEAEVEQYLDKNKIFYEAENPTCDDDVPIEIRNGAYSSLFEPILRMYSLPKYSDLDVTPFFAPFFMLFFGLCMGDAGYGAIILFVSLLLRTKLKPALKPYGTLGAVLGCMTIVCGALTGSFFGIDLTQSDWAVLAPIKHYFINDHNFTLFGYSPMMVVSVVIGFVQVLFGMVLAAVKAGSLYGWRYGVGKISWVVALLSAVSCFGLPVCGVELPTFVVYVLHGLMAVSAIGIFLYNTPNKNIFMNCATGLWDTYGMATGLLGDLLSYIRLFALGLTGGVLGGVFNSLAIDLTSSMPWTIRWLPMLIILLLGHGINFALCMISSFVHPMRLTFVEFFKNANFEGGGRAYSPFHVKSYKQD